MPYFDPLDSGVISDPYPCYDRLRETAPVFFSERLDSWVVTGYDECRRVLTDTATFASDWSRAGLAAAPSVASMQELDPPGHTPIRRVFATALRRQDLNRIGAEAFADARERVEKLASAAEPFDFTEELARPVALQAVSALLGIEPPPVGSFGRLSDALVRGMDAGLVPELAEPALAARRELNTLIEQWFSAARGTGLLAEVLPGAGGLARDDVWNSARVLFLAGFSTTVGAAANAVLALATHPDGWDRVTPTDTAVDELLRYDGPVQGTTRACVEDGVPLGGVTVHRGQLVLALIGAANRDPGRFLEPDRLVLDRRPNHHLALGWGVHSCFGAALARIIVRALLASLLRMPERLRLAAPPHRVPRATLRYPDVLPVVFGPCQGV